MYTLINPPKYIQDEREKIELNYRDIISLHVNSKYTRFTRNNLKVLEELHDKYKRKDPNLYTPLDNFRDDKNLKQILMITVTMNKFLYDFRLYDNFYTLNIQADYINEIRSQLDKFNIICYYIDNNNNIFINDIDIPTHYILSQLIYLPSWKVIWDIQADINYLEYFLEHKPNFIPGYLDRNINEYPRFLELVANEVSYEDIIIDMGIKYLNSKEELDYGDYSINRKELIPIITEKMVARVNLTDNDRIYILNLLLEVTDNPKSQRLLNRLFIHMLGLPMNSITFDIKSNAETLLKLGKMINK